MCIYTTISLSLYIYIYIYMCIYNSKYPRVAAPGGGGSASRMETYDLIIK